MKRISLSVLAAWLLMINPAAGLDDQEPFAEPAKQALYEQLTDEVRCLVCQNQTIGDSNAPLAADLRREVYEMVRPGGSSPPGRTDPTPALRSGDGSGPKRTAGPKARIRS